MEICQIKNNLKINKKIQIIINKTILTYKDKMLFRICSNNRRFKEEKTFLNEKDF
jgi:hypothetical protein